MTPPDRRLNVSAGEGGAGPAPPPAARFESALAFAGYFLLAILYFLRAFTRRLLIAPGDSQLVDVPLRRHYADAFSVFHPALWLPHEFLGTSLAGILHNGFFYPPNLVFLALPFAPAFNGFILMHFALGATFTRRYLRQLGCGGLPASMAGLAFGFSGFLMAHKGHVSILCAAAWLPLIVCEYDAWRRSGAIRHLVVAALAMALQFNAGHTQICVETWLLLGFAAAYHFARDPRSRGARSLLLQLAPFPLFAALSLPQYLATSELLSLAGRSVSSYSYFSEYSLPPAMLPTLIFPYIFGGVPGLPYQGAWNMAELSGFTGLLPLAAAIWIFLARRRADPRVAFWGAAAILAMLYCFGRYVPWYRLFYYLPLFNLFRASARYLLIFDFAVAVLFGLGMQQLLTPEAGGRTARALGRTLAGLVVVVVALWLGVLLGLRHEGFRSFFSFPPQLQIAALPGAGSWVVWGPLALAAGYLAALRLHGRLRSAAGCLLLLAALTLGEAWLFGVNLNAEWPAARVLEEHAFSPAYDYLKKRPAPGRAAYAGDDIIPLYNVPAGVRMLNGYDPLVNRELKALTGLQTNGTTLDWSALLDNNVLLSALNVRHILVKSGRESAYPALAGAVPPVTGAWGAVNAGLSGETAELASPDGTAVSLLHATPPLRPDTDYLVSLEARAPRPLTSPLVADFYGGAAYDNPEQDFAIPSRAIGDRFQVFSRVINTGRMPAGAELRLYTFSTERVFVRRLKLQEVGRNILSGDWQTLHAATGPDGYRLAAAPPENLAFLLQGIAVKPDTFYVMALDIRAQQPLIARIHCDFYGGPDYDNGEQELGVDAAEIGAGYRTYLRVIRSGHPPAAGVKFRIFTDTTIPVEIRNVALLQLSDYRPTLAPPLSASASTPRPGRDYRLVLSSDEVTVFENLHALPRARAVTGLREARDIGEVRKAFFMQNFDPANTALVNSRDFAALGGLRLTDGSVRLARETTDRLVLETDFPGEGFVVLADQFFPGWHARVDGRETPVYQVDGVLRGVRVPAGRHPLEFSYEPSWLLPGFLISGLALLSCLAALVTLPRSARCHAMPCPGMNQPERLV